MTPADFSPKPVRMGPVVFGLVLILLGALLLMDQTAPGLARKFGPWWPLLIALLGIGRLVDRGPLHLGGHILLGLSLALLAGSFDQIALLSRYWPVGVIWLGLVITGRAFWLHPATKGNA